MRLFISSNYFMFFCYWTCFCLVKRGHFLFIKYYLKINGIRYINYFET